ncbi:DUF4440 domain-containing protein [Coxiella endosymbiont of Ornithodoros maritimus]|uniref:DUF4440 domain-containing protein n=1 Tax=Coxiella endosymbiont of Ornithodoros maritimus TaxID=1656172 RepID=UPI002B3FFC76|nr:DUF4440 domain-containing protein [Coxiella endosymbiont of Ornithodoros maritimus]
MAENRRQAPDHVQELLADDFVEFGSSGQIYSKRNLLKALSEENNSSIAMLNPQSTQLDNYVILLT